MRNQRCRTYITLPFNRSQTITVAATGLERGGGGGGGGGKPSRSLSVGAMDWAQAGRPPPVSWPLTDRVFQTRYLGP